MPVPMGAAFATLVSMASCRASGDRRSDALRPPAASISCCWATAVSHLDWPCSSIIDALQSSDTLVRSDAPCSMSEKDDTVMFCDPTTPTLPSRIVPTTIRIGTPRNQVNPSRRVIGSELLAPIGTAGAFSGFSSA